MNAAKWCKMFGDSKVIDHAKLLRLEIKAKQSEEKLISGRAVYLQNDRPLRQNVHTFLPPHNPHVSATVNLYGRVKV
jgi:hypothetical protein